jgi:hypothetical protein
LEVEVLESKECLGVEHERVVVPTKVRVGKHVFDVVFPYKHAPAHGFIYGESLRAFENVRVRDIPSDYLYLRLKVEGVGWLTIGQPCAILTIFTDDWKDDSILQLAEEAYNEGFKVSEPESVGKLYRINFIMCFTEPADITVGEAYGMFKDIIRRVKKCKHIIMVEKEDLK